MSGLWNNRGRPGCGRSYLIREIGHAVSPRGLYR